MPQQRSDQHHPPGTPTMMHPATAAGPPIVAPSPAYSAQYFTCSPQQFTNQPLVQQMTHYQSQVRISHLSALDSEAQLTPEALEGSVFRTIQNCTGALVSWLNVSSSRQRLDEVIRRSFPSLLKCRADDWLHLLCMFSQNMYGNTQCVGLQGVRVFYWPTVRNLFK